MAQMTREEIAKHNENPNIMLKVSGKPFHCGCGCNVFHHVDDNEIFICNGCKTEYVSDDYQPSKSYA